MVFDDPYQLSKKATETLETIFAPMLQQCGAVPVLLQTPANKHTHSIPELTATSRAGLFDYKARLDAALPQSQAARVAPVGDVFLAVREDRPDLWTALFNSDGKSFSALGASLQACVLHRVIFKSVPPEGRELASFVPLSDKANDDQGAIKYLRRVVERFVLQEGIGKGLSINPMIAGKDRTAPQARWEFLKRKKRTVIANRTDEDYANFNKVVIPKSEPHRAAILKALQGHFLFGDLGPNSLKDLVGVMKPRSVAPGNDVITQGALGEEFFVLVEGVCEVLIEGVGKVHQYDNLGAFGELALMYSSPRAATIRATTKSELYTLDLRTFRFVLTQASAFMDRVKFLRKLAFLEPLGDNKVTQIARALTEETYRDGTYIIRQGDMGDAFYIIETGKVKCTVTKSKGSEASEVDLVTLEAGENFGEMALMLDGRRHANCIAFGSDVTCLKLPKNKFVNMFGPLQAMFERQMRMRILRSVPLLSILSIDELSKVAEIVDVQRVDPGTRIIKEGDYGIFFYIVNAGTVKVTQRRFGRNKELALLRENDYFGERALIKNEPRKASVTAVTTVELLVLEQKLFQQLILPSAQGNIEELMAQRGKEANARREMEASLRVHKKKSVSFGNDPARPRIPFEELRLVKKIGAGTFGRVKLVHHRTSNRVLALKCMSKAQIVSKHQEKNVMNEKNILDECAHPFILEQIATYQNAAELFILMELIQGGELWTYMYEKTDLIPRGPMGGFTEPTAHFYSGCLVSALGYIHSLGVAYRDLKPENLLMDSTGYIKIIDFGFAKHIPFMKKGKLQQKKLYLVRDARVLVTRAGAVQGPRQVGGLLGARVPRLRAARRAHAFPTRQPPGSL